jgi:FKBP-type peptidyl-prolyl cis-trans isomerase
MIGSTGSIAGWDDGLRLFKKGGKGRLYIPSSMAYGKQGAPPRIKPNENLIFDVEIVDVTDKMPQPNLPGAPSKGK